MLKNINLVFEDQEYADLLKIKEEKRMTWRELLLSTINGDE